VAVVTNSSTQRATVAKLVTVPAMVVDHPHVLANVATARPKEAGRLADRVVEAGGGEVGIGAALSGV